MVFPKTKKCSGYANDTNGLRRAVVGDDVCL